MVATARKTEISDRIIKRITTLREARGWTQQQTADRFTEHGFPMHRANLDRMLKGRRTITVDEAMSVANAFGISLEDLITGECEVCDSQPPAGFQCKSCGAEG